MSPAEIAAKDPQRAAYIIAETGQVVTYAELEADANRGAQFFRSLGLQRGDHIALLLENHPDFFKICWAAQRSGLYFTAISWRLQQAEVEYIVNNCEARVFITSGDRRAVVEPLQGRMAHVEACFTVEGDIPGYRSWQDTLAAMPAEPIADECEGAAMLYSSGTTGYPKGVKRPLPEHAYGEGDEINIAEVLYGCNEQSIYLSPAPLYHAAPLAFTMGCLRNGTTVVVMQHFEAEYALECVERYQITHSQWVPTMFVRMLKLPEEVRTKYDVSTMQAAIHAAAPCPIPIKEKMIE